MYMYIHKPYILSIYGMCVYMVYVCVCVCVYICIDNVIDLLTPFHNWSLFLVLYNLFEGTNSLLN